MRIALLYNLKKKDSSKPRDFFSECDSEETVNSIAEALSKRGHKVDAVDVEYRRLFHYFKEKPADLVFNISEGLRGEFRESEVPALLEYLNIPYTGSRAFPLALAMNKATTKKILRAEGIPTPSFQLFASAEEELDSSLRFPLIVKPNCEGSAKGILRSSVVDDELQMRIKVREVIARYHQDALVEEFIEGRELTVGILENAHARILPILEIDFSSCKQSGEYFYSWTMKEFQGRPGLAPTFHCPARIDEETARRVRDAALKTHRAIGCLDISRTDIRLSFDNVPYVLEINPLPGLDPRESNFPLMAYAAGMKYEDLIEAIVLSASERIGLN